MATSGKRHSGRHDKAGASRKRARVRAMHWHGHLRFKSHIVSLVSVVSMEPEASLPPVLECKGYCNPPGPCSEAVFKSVDVKLQTTDDSNRAALQAVVRKLRCKGDKAACLGQTTGGAMMMLLPPAAGIDVVQSPTMTILVQLVHDYQRRYVTSQSSTRNESGAEHCAVLATPEDQTTCQSALLPLPRKSLVQLSVSARPAKGAYEDDVRGRRMWQGNASCSTTLEPDSEISLRIDHVAAFVGAYRENIEQSDATLIVLQQREMQLQASSGRGASNPFVLPDHEHHTAFLLRVAHYRSTTASARAAAVALTASGAAMSAVKAAKRCLDVIVMDKAIYDLMCGGSCKKSVKIMQALIHAQRISVNFQRRADEATPLIAAAAVGSLSLVHWLVIRGARVDSRSASGQTALDVAIARRKSRVVNFLSRPNNWHKNAAAICDMQMTNGAEVVSCTAPQGHMQVSPGPLPPAHLTSHWQRVRHQLGLCERCGGRHDTLRCPGGGIRVPPAALTAQPPCTLVSKPAPAPGMQSVFAVVRPTAPMAQGADAPVPTTSTPPPAAYHYGPSGLSLVEPPQCAEPAKLFLGGLSWQTTEQSILHHFQQFGVVLCAVVQRDPNTQKPRGFGFVTFADKSVVPAVLQAVNTIDGKCVDVKHAIALGVAVQ